MPQDENLHIVYVVNFQQTKVTFLYLTSLLQVKIFMEIASERRMFLTGKIWCYAKRENNCNARVQMSIFYRIASGVLFRRLW
jgi:hypothetical protein